VVDPNRPAGGGEYPNQDGFGWTNGVALALSAQLAGTTAPPADQQRTHVTAPCDVKQAG
jgi:alpha,alpha-trehalase